MTRGALRSAPRTEAPSVLAPGSALVRCLPGRRHGQAGRSPGRKCPMRSVRTLLRGLVAASLLAIVVIPSSAVASSRQDRTERAILRAMNKVRSQNGLSTLRVDSALARAADAHSAAMLRSGVFSHGSVHARLRRYTKKRKIGET